MSPLSRSALPLTRTPARGAVAALAAATIGLLAAGAVPAQAVVLDPAPGETVTVDFPFRADGGQYSWVVPEGVTEVTVDLAAGSGGSIAYADSDRSLGGPGGRLIAHLDTVETTTLILAVGGAGVGNAGGGATAIATIDAVLAAAGGGGAGWGCALGGVECAAGGAGGFSAVSGSSAGVDGVNSSPLESVSVAGTGASAAAAGVSAPEVTVSIVDGVESAASVRVSAIQPPSSRMAVVDGVIVPANGPVGADVTGGGSGYFAAGHGASLEITETVDGVVSRSYFSGGGGGGSGYLQEGAELVELRDNVGDGFASISYVVPPAPGSGDPAPDPEVRVTDPGPEPEPDSGDDSETDIDPELINATEPTLAVSATVVRAGGDLQLSGGGFPSDRAYPIILNSDPVLLGDITTDARGAFTTTVTIPAVVHPGAHVISVGEASIPITVVAAETVPAPPTVPDAGPQPELAASGPAETLGAAGLLALTMLAWGALLLRRVRQAEHV